MKINVPMTEGSFQVTGKVMWLKLGDKKHKFFMQDDGNLAEFRTGRIIIPSNSIKSRQILYLAGRGVRAELRAILQELIDELVDNNTLELVLDVLNAEEGLN